MLMAPGPSSWLAEATVSRSLVRPDRIIGPEVHRRAAAASDEATEHSTRSSAARQPFTATPRTTRFSIYYHNARSGMCEQCADLVFSEESGRGVSASICLRSQLV